VPTLPPTILGISVPPDSTLCGEGYGSEAPAIAWEKAQGVFSYAGSMVQEVAADIVVDHDTDWEKYPEVTEAIRQAGGEPDCVAIAKSPSQLKWGVGLAAGWQGRERAAKVALSVAVTSGTEKMAKLAREYPEFRTMCEAADLLLAGAATGGCGGGEFSAPTAMPLLDMGGKPPASPVGMKQDCPPVITVFLQPDAQLCLRGLPQEAFAISYGGKSYKNFFANAHSILSELVGDISEIAYNDDPDWKHYPEVADAIKQAGGEENCYMVATIVSLGTWAVGLAAGKKARESACKMGLALALAQTSDQLSRLARSYPEFGAILATVGLEVASEAAVKKRKFEETTEDSSAVWLQ
jgi:hypothetical protein